MKTKGKQGALQNSVVRIVLVTLAILMIPVVGMQLSSEWNWGPLDFLIMGALIFGTGLLLNTLLTKVKDPNKRILFGILIILGFLFIWAELAVGIFTNLGS